MAKIGTAHIEIKPVVNLEALDAIAEQLAAAVAEGVARGMRKANTINVEVNAGTAEDFACSIADAAAQLR
jgi:hypothetical protein